MSKNNTKPQKDNSVVDVKEVVNEMKNETTVSDVKTTVDPVKEDVKTEVVEPVKEVVTKPSVEAKVALKVGMTVKLKASATKTVTGLTIPAFAYRNIYKVSKILPSRILITAGKYTIAVKSTDVEVQ